MSTKETVFTPGPIQNKTKETLEQFKDIFDGIQINNDRIVENSAESNEEKNIISDEVNTEVNTEVNNEDNNEKENSLESVGFLSDPNSK